MAPRRIEVTRPDKMLWPALGITKQAFVDYLGSVADRMLPWLRDRPLTLIRAPDGVEGQRYFQKDTPAYAPSGGSMSTTSRSGRSSWSRRTGAGWNSRAAWFPSHASVAASLHTV